MFSFLFGKKVVEKRRLFFTNLCLSCVSKTCVSKKKHLLVIFVFFQPGIPYRCKSQKLNANIFIYIFEHKSKFATKKGIEKILPQIVEFAILSKNAYHSVCSSTI